MKHTIRFAVLGLCLTSGSVMAATSVFNGGDFLTAGNWSLGLPTAASGNDGSIATDGTTGILGNVTGWGTFVMSSGTIAAGGDWDFRGANFTMSGGTLNVSDDIFAGGGAVYTFNGGTVRWGFAAGGTNDAQFKPNTTTAGSAILINGGVFEAGDNKTTKFGNFEAGTLTINGGSFSNIDQFEFTQGSSTLGGSASLTGGSATGSWNNSLDIQANWAGSWTITSFAGSSWEDMFTNNRIRFDGANIDAATFNSTFQVTNNGQTLALVPEPSAALLGGIGLLALLRRRRP